MHKILTLLFICFSGLAQCQTTFNKLVTRDSVETAGSFLVIETDTGYIASYVHFIPDGNMRRVEVFIINLKC